MYAQASVLLACCSAIVAQVTTGEWGQQAKEFQRRLVCPLCSFHFSHREHNRAGRTCPNCKVSVGIPFYYRVILASVGYFFMALVMYVGYQDMGSTWLLMGLPFAQLAALIIQAAGYIILPPRLQAHAEGGTWLKLS
jgi:hypothetical protein